MAAKVSKLIMTAVCMVAIGIMSASAFAENTAKGKLTVDGKTAEIQHVIAYSQPGFFDKKKQDVVVLMCDAPVSIEIAKEPMGIYDQVKAGKLHCVRQTINSEKQVINFEVSHNRFKMTVSGGSTDHVFESKTFTGNSISGRSVTKKPQTSGFDDVPYSYDITFSAEITAPQSRKVGTKVPADGGDLWKAYLAHNKKIKTMSIKEMRKMMPPDVSEETSDKELKAMKELAVAMLPKNPKFVEGYVNGEKAVLFITDHTGKEKKFGTVDMMKEEGEWTVEKENWSDNPPAR